ncbi:polysaccharide biosynthesis/export family protein [Flavicella sp.]|uniref:polysaccharide biosynthesis/export family protein n=1 Tax=Flavicella sp. TaxID=2957742 RepID=UPI00301653AC
MSKIYAVLILMVVLLSSCASKKDLLYFQGIDTKEQVLNTDFSPKIKAGDQLSIMISALDPLAVIPFNSFKPNMGTGNGNVELLPYSVAQDGTIEFPQLGTIEVAGYTRVELIAVLKEKLAPFLVNPSINIQWLNFTITVLGEVKSPGAYIILDERVTILDAIGLAGDLTIHGVRQNVLVIRETDTEKQFERIDLTATNLFESPVYYLQQNDVVYVEPNKPRVNSSAASSVTGIWISITSLTITIIALIVN